MTKDAEPSGNGLLSKVVKFVKSPTTHWADIDRPAAQGDGNESRLILKEMIERKRRNDFVRKREFDMLRKVRQRGAGRGGEPAAGGPSMFSSSELSQGGERAHTLKKIDEIEAQMSNAWLRRRQDTAVGHESSMHSGTKGAMAQHSAEASIELPLADSGVSPQAFAPTLTMDQVVIPPATLDAFAPEAGAFDAGLDTLDGGGQAGLQVEVAAKQDEQLEEAAIRFANGDAEGAESALLALLSNGNSRSNDVEIWLTLFDLYRCVDNVTSFDNAAIDFAARFGRSAPQWSLMGESLSRGVADRTAAGATRTGQFDWVCPSTLNAQAVVALAAALDRHGSPWRVDWRHLKVVEHAALRPLVATFKRWAETPGGFEFLAVERLLEQLADHSRTEDSDSDPLWWETQLALLRVLDHMDEFELVALNYCVTYEVSPPAWEAPKNRFRALAEEGHATEDSELAGLGLPGFALAPALSETATAEHAAPGVVRAALSGAYVGSAAALVRHLTAQPEARAYELDCRHLTRIDFGAAGDLLNWSMDQQAKGRSVTFRQVNRLVAAFFGVIGIDGAAGVTLRTD